jgi:hypothetical protein
MADLGALLFEKEKEKASDRWPISRPIEREMDGGFQITQMLVFEFL